MKVNSQPRVIADNSVHEAFREHAKAVNWLSGYFEGDSAIYNGLTKITVGTTEPANPSVGDLWVDTN